MNRSITKTGLDVTPILSGSPPRKGRKQQFPGRFIRQLRNLYCFEGARTLLLFSGKESWADSVDLDESTNPTYSGHYEEILAEMVSDSYDIVLADPPYSIGFGREWTRQDSLVPRPKKILECCSWVTVPGGLMMILHTIIIPAYKAFRVRRVGLHPVFTGPNNAIRVLNVFTKEESL